MGNKLSTYNIGSSVESDMNLFKIKERNDVQEMLQLQVYYIMISELNKRLVWHIVNAAN